MVHISPIHNPKKLTKSKKYQQIALFTSFINNTVKSTIIKSKTFRDILQKVQFDYGLVKANFPNLVEQIGLFGNYARDETTPNSDIDIFIKMKLSLF